MPIPSKHQKALERDGYAVIPDILAAEEMGVYRQRLLELAAAERDRQVARMHSEDRGQLVRWLVNKGEIFERLVAHPKMMPYFEYLLGEDYTLSTLTSNIISPGAADGNYHVDHRVAALPGPLPDFALVANSLWLLDDFSAENGGTRLVPGTHRGCEKMPDGLKSHPDEVRVAAPKGSVLLFNGAVWHSAGANRTAKERIALICFCCRSFLKPMFDFVHYLKPEVVARATPTMRRIYGFDSQPQPPDEPLGGLDGAGGMK